MRTAGGAAPVHETGTARRADLRGIRLLLPVWGRRHLDQFLNASLPTLLWPGNVPALARSLPCEFVAMTSGDDAETLAAHPHWQALRQICPARIVIIDDLIADVGYAVTVTLAYARAMRALGPAMLDTGFIFLVADLLVADGSLAAVLARLRGGADGILAGNFQAAAEAVARFWPGGSITPTAPLAPRPLVRWSLDHLHPQTLRAVVNAGYGGTQSADRLFWRVDRDTLLGCFYLLHMIAIRPEVCEFTIAAACDYSFIPELCPSNRVVVLTDSDEYFVTELQSSDVAEPIEDSVASLDPEVLARHLSRWTTVRHRENARHSILFHAGDFALRLDEIRAEADSTIDAIGRRLAAVPQPHRDHPYWVGGTALWQATTGRPAPELRSRLGTDATRLWWRMRLSGFGRPPAIRPWHPRWPDFAAARARLGCDGTVLILSDEPRSFGYWASRPTLRATSVRREIFEHASPPRQIGAAGSFDRCLLVVPDEGAGGVTIRAVEGLQRMLKPEGELVVLVIKDLRDDPSTLDPDGAAAIEGALAKTGWAMQRSFVASGTVRRALQQRIVTSARAMRYGSRAVAASRFLACAILAPVSWVCNEIALRRATGSARPSCSSALFVMRSPAGRLTGKEA
jgi:hypothetical protein